MKGLSIDLVLGVIPKENPLDYAVTKHYVSTNWARYCDIDTSGMNCW